METSTRSTGIDWQQEVRFSVVMYGGVSLAIYINGVAQELLHMVQATAADPASGGLKPLLRPDDPLDGPQAQREREGGALTGTAAVYREIGRMLAPRVEPGNEREPEAGTPVRTRFVVDVVSGTSAGGINGVYLAKALANGQPMDALKELWVNEGDIGLLINDARSVADLSPLPPSDPPRSLLNSQRMYHRLLMALRGMDEEKSQGPLVDELDLFLTTTDIRGTPVPLSLADRVVHERRHRNVFRFRHTRAGTGHFGRSRNPVLAFAARCTSAFPFAFEPMSVEEARTVLAHFPAPGETLNARLVASFMENEVGGDSAGERAFGDGGYLDNKPFGWALQGAARRRAALPVRRTLLYIEPNPEHPEGEAVTTRPPNALENVQAALVGIPRYESIREDLQQLLARNRLVERTRAILRGLEEDFRRAAPPGLEEDFRPDAPPEPEPATPYVEQDLHDQIGAYGIAYGGYHRLKVAQVTDFLASTAAAAAGFDRNSDVFHALRYLVQAWRNSRYRHYLQEEQRERGLRSFNLFLVHFDLEYRLRRLRFVLGQLDELTVQAEREDAQQEAAEAGRTLRRELQGVQGRLLTVLDGLEQRGEGNLLRRALAEREHLVEDGPREAVGFLVDDLLGLGSEDERDRLAERVMRQAAGSDEKGRPLPEAALWLGRALTAAIEALEEVVRAATIPAAAQVEEAFGRGESRVERRVRAKIHALHSHFEVYDAIAYPIFHASGVPEEQTVVDVLRISPEDLKPPYGRPPKLAGTAFASFGAFLDVRWRRNDFLWGRLDGAARIITALLPHPPQRTLREQMIRRAREAILAEELNEDQRPKILNMLAHVASEENETAWYAATGKQRKERRERILAAIEAAATPDEVYDHFEKEYQVDRDLDRGAMSQAAARATTVVGRMLEDMSAPGSRGRTASGWVARAGRAAWSAVELATPRSIPRAVVRYMVTLLAVFSGLLTAIGVIVGEDDLRNLGLTWLGVTSAILIARALLENWVRGGSGLVRVARATGLLVGALLLFLAAQGAAAALGPVQLPYGWDLTTLLVIPAGVPVAFFALSELWPLVRGMLRVPGRVGAWWLGRRLTRASDRKRRRRWWWPFGGGS